MTAAPLPDMAPRPGLFARALRGSAITAGSYALAQALRLASNLILTRLLFPEAFGMMALVSVFLVGLSMFSDVGIGPAIAQNRRGDDPSFLNTAWTIQVIRGLLLWLATCAVALPAARFYDAPELALLLPAAGVTLLISGFSPTRIDTANRHLLLGRVTALDLASQIVGMVAMVALALAMGSIWALVLGAIVGAVARLVLMQRFLPGPRNRFAWDAAAGVELIRFGKWIFLSTACGFLLAQGDKAILGAYLPLDALGVYNIGYFLASFPMLLGGAVTGRILIPLYRDHPPGASAANAARLRRLRHGVSGTVLALLAVMAFAGVPLVGLLYDARYAGAGAIVVLIACVQMPAVIGMTYDQAALAAGDSRSYFLVIALKAAVQTLAFLIGAETGGLAGALVAQGVALAAVHPAIIWLARRHGVWDGGHDLVCALAVLVLGGLALWVNLGALQALGG
ncbi:oligosaccharide flippase family protein [Paracoccaceae bacterium Fryx2]|nr:oligosaccharide flippase family protein [Paracoccaceae bacterium Fryx2]